MMTITTTPTTQPTTTPATLDEESSLSIGAAVTVVLVDTDDKLAVVVAKEISLLLDGLTSENVSLTENTMTYCRIYAHSKHSSQYTYVAIN